MIPTYDPLGAYVNALGNVTEAALPLLRNTLINVLGATPNEKLTPDASTTTADGGPQGNVRPVESANTRTEEDPPPRVTDPVPPWLKEVILNQQDPQVIEDIARARDKVIAERDRRIADLRLKGQQEVTRRQAQNNVINAWKDVEVATIQKERDMALGLAEIAYRSSMPNPAVMQQLNAAAQVGVSAFGNKPLPVQ